jgi:hypothetical protein
MQGLSNDNAAETMSRPSLPDQGERKYEERYCAYIDILGFTELIADIGKGRIEFKVVRDVLAEIHEPRKFEAAGFADFQATTISDAIALSTNLSVAGLRLLTITGWW